MKTCPVCALELEDTFLFCPDDGSGLDRLSPDSIDKTPTTIWTPQYTTSSSSVLYCPTCAAEYPLTFSTCPVHDVLLTKHRIPKIAYDTTSAEATLTAGPDNASTPATMQERPKRGRDLTSRDLTSIVLQRPEVESSKIVNSVVTASEQSDDTPHQDLNDHEQEHTETQAAPPRVITPFGYWEAPNDADAPGADRPGFRIAAIATVVALGILGLVAAAKVLANLTRRPSVSSRIVAKSDAAPEPSSFVATPKEAQEYRETPAAETLTNNQETSTTSPVRQKDQTKAPADPVATPERDAHRTAMTQANARPVATAAVAPAPARVSNPPLPPLPRGNGGGFDARLIRVRSNRTTAGVRYDLTFNMQEQAGRMAQWQRVLISTRTLSGISHSQAIPFSHRLGATGALTFTISVELNGRSEADWQGRVICTTLGWDRDGAPLQASFGANVTP